MIAGVPNIPGCITQLKIQTADSSAFIDNTHSLWICAAEIKTTCCHGRKGRGNNNYI